MGENLTKDGKFKSDKYEWCPPNFMAFSFDDDKAWPLLRDYARRIRDDQPAFAADILKAIENAQLADRRNWHSEWCSVLSAPAGQGGVCDCKRPKARAGE